MNWLSQLATKHGTDKGPKVHGYTEVYLGHLPTAPQAVLEFGILRGASMRMWSEFYPEAKLFGVDWGAGSVFSDFFEGAQANQEISAELRELAENWAQEFDLIVDDGAHTLTSQKNCLEVFAPWVARGGVYIVEDAEVEGFDLDPPVLEGFEPPLVLKAPNTSGRSVIYVRSDPCSGGQEEAQAAIVLPA